MLKFDLGQRSQGQRLRSNIQVCKKTCLDYKLWTNGWILMLLANMIDDNRMLMLTHGQGHKVKGQGQICNFVKNIVSTIYHEPMIRY